ncbi:hypothetical protein [Actinoplanes sp. NBRC 101535]|uniref:hypothetical protein n=1 Tax=Actinoplanes sp. NBRC 101535 TaxID=3032196 RepID=UPI0024A2D549|nr:hypothetical protein [Actinoplanes sp. NBRC 101535]GLY06029.1 hypothetical protein Acsp01_64080 [Actinoplanes sp. NBRC 101535]
MSRHHNRQPGRLLAVGAAGLAVVLGGGAYLISSQSDDDTTAQDVRVLATSAAAVPSASPPESAGASPTKEPKETRKAEETPEPVPSEAASAIDEARRKMAEDGVKVDRPVAPKVSATADDVKMTTKGSLDGGGIVRVYTAHGDLTGQKELAYVAGGIKEHRDVPCSQTFKFATNPKPAKKDNMLMCWRTTATKSVVAIVVDPEGKPSRDKAVDIVEKNWRSMD